ncbi:hypothetical protein Acsp01_30210 [Actinoplanes sp. NBRC 101535]|nr:hypothetical protein Acsp01_30210 [Actinoplanes sp. NBRC 101535]
MRWIGRGARRPPDHRSCRRPQKSEGGAARVRTQRLARAEVADPNPRKVTNMDTVLTTLGTA